jgi:predicted  nucleic acid-binding Zn-ribbon protein
MSELSVLIELQSVHDNLRTIQRDLSAFPPDLASLDAELKILAKKIEETSRGLVASRSLFASLTVELGGATKAEEVAKASVKVATQKIQYTAAIRELDERQRQKNAVARPVKETENRIESLERLDVDLKERQIEAQKQFDELKGVFLAEHENQVEAQARLLARSQELEGTLQPTLLVKFKRLLQQRQGRAVVGVDGGACGGCRTRLRTPFVASLRESDTLFCESCQRILYDPSRL